MELRRAILLFAIVLAVAAIVSSIARPPDRGSDGGGGAQTAPPAREPSASAANPAARPAEPATVEFPAAAKPQTRKIEVGQAATVLVDVATAGQVAIPSLGLVDAAEPLTPAMFDVLVSAKGSHAIVAQPAAAESPPEKVGTLKVVPPS